MVKDLNIFKYNLAFFLRAMMLLFPVMLLFYQQNGLSVQELFFFQGVSYFVSIIAELPVGYLSNNFSRRQLLMTSFLMYLLVTVLWLIYSGYWIVLFGEVLFGISKIIMDNAMSGYLYDYLDKTNREEQMTKYYGLLNCYLALGTSVAAIIGTYIYAKYGTKVILVSECFIISVIIALIASLPNIKISKVVTFNESVKHFITSARRIVLNQSIIYHILLSGLLTGCSILFALSFQPLIQHSSLPIFMFGVVAFVNHFLRSLGSFCSKFLNNVSIAKIANALLWLYVLAFLLILFAFKIKNGIFTTVSIILICFFIALQLIFAILNVSRLHTYVPINNRGVLMSVNNLVTRSFAAIILITSKLFINKSGYEVYYIIVFVLFYVICSFLVTKINLKKV